ncbi:hypothetical protein RFI_10678 [Reticulomyxa filosa]|uniref:Uncharacterized protein n=1 Tax=Reticulomyxa filosa TaxID=46433 RepID=X6NKM9_RETFI|nr:hypothetical protein RFI_10678 [Reticulomyxa filosa]|eukprot:ETO26458.1 hypothetical protein RFI_10678 [Reticulomyxa filosa]
MCEYTKQTRAILTQYLTNDKTFQSINPSRLHYIIDLARCCPTLITESLVLQIDKAITQIAEMPVPKSTTASMSESGANGNGSSIVDKSLRFALQLLDLLQYAQVIPPGGHVELLVDGYMKIEKKWLQSIAPAFASDGLYTSPFRKAMLPVVCKYPHKFIMHVLTTKLVDNSNPADTTHLYYLLELLSDKSAHSLRQAFQSEEVLSIIAQALTKLKDEKNNTKGTTPGFEKACRLMCLLACVCRQDDHWLTQYPLNSSLKDFVVLVSTSIPTMLAISQSLFAGPHNPACSVELLEFCKHASLVCMQGLVGSCDPVVAINCAHLFNEKYWIDFTYFEYFLEQTVSLFLQKKKK